jgi:DNA-directed RNA polymerase subunit RPC12/RpoP
VIKFRCPNCGQKIAANDEGADSVIACPNCVESVIVPPRTAEEFLVRAGAPLASLLSDAEPEHLNRVSHAETRAARAETLVRTGLLPHLARLMMDKLFRAVLNQRAQLMDSQSLATTRLVEMEERLLRIQERMQDRLLGYEQRIKELEQELAAREEENRELVRLNFHLSRRALEIENARRPARVDLRDAGFLLRA